jgi:transposase
MPDVPTHPDRFVALDVHKQYAVVAAVDREQHVALAPRRVTFERLGEWMRVHLRPTDAVVLEATTNAWQFYDEIAPLVASVTVAHPLKVAVIAAARVKTDARDTLALARLLAAGLVPAVWVPPRDVRDLRALLAHRERLIRQRTQARNRLHSILHQYNLVPPEGSLFGQEQRAWWQNLELRPLERVRVRQDLAVLESLEPLIAEVDAELMRQSVAAPWANQMSFVMQLPGMGVINALTVLAAIGDITRFPTAKHLAGYAGLGASVHASGQVYRTGRITKEGRRELRAAMVEAAWIAVERHPHWKAHFARLAARVGPAKAIVAVARKLLVAVWHVLSQRAADRHADPVAVARKFMRWGANGRVATGQGLTRGGFVRYHLERLGLGAEMTVLIYNKSTIHLPPSASDGAPPLSAAIVA